MDRLTHTAVKLLLIVAIATQPVIAVALKADCSTGCNSQFTCEGCGGCSVATPDDRCSCCSGRAKSTAEDSEGCGRCVADEQPSAIQSEDDPFADVEIAENGDSPSCCSDENFDTSSDSLALDSTCACLHSPESPYVPAPRTPATEVRDLVSLGFTLSPLPDATEQPASSADVASAPSSTISHFAQIRLCVWRL